MRNCLAEVESGKLPWLPGTKGTPPPRHVLVNTLWCKQTCAVADPPQRRCRESASVLPTQIPSSHCARQRLGGGRQRCPCRFANTRLWPGACVHVREGNEGNHCSYLIAATACTLIQYKVWVYCVCARIAIKHHDNMTLNPMAWPRMSLHAFLSL